MPINKFFKTIFIHVPKCAGTSISQMLDMTTISQLYYSGSPQKYSSVYQKYRDKFTEEEFLNLLVRPPQHLTVKEVKKILGQQAFDDSFVFTVVRNPYARVVSCFNKSVKRYYQLPGFTSFTDFVNSIVISDTRTLKLQGHLNTQTFFLKDENSSFNSFDQIYKFENLTPLFNKINEIYPQIPIIHSNKSIEQDYDYKSFYTTPDLVEKVYNVYKEDFENFNYSINLNGE